MLTLVEKSQVMPKSYALVTPARNEEDFIELTIQSVIAQTVKPVLWVIISDRSVDRTDEIVTSYAKEYSFIRLIRNESPSERNTAAKVHAINLGINALAGVEYEFFGNLDADVSFGNNYFETLLTYLENDSKLGIVGGWLYQKDSQGDVYKLDRSAESVAGAVQLFRRTCFDQIGGYKSIPGGMEDGIAEITARYHGWKTCSFAELPVIHHRELGTVGRSVYKARFNSGLTEYLVGFGWTYHAIRAGSRVLEKPYFIGAMLILGGYMYGLISRRKRVVPDTIIRFIRQEQRTKLMTLLMGKRQSVQNIVGA